MTIENPQATAYQQLVTLGRERVLVLDNPQEIQNLVSALARAVLAAVNAGLTPDEIREACREGTGTTRQFIVDPSLDPEYWLKVHAEAEAFWESRSSDGDDEAYSD